MLLICDKDIRERESNDNISLSICTKERKKVNLLKKERKKERKKEVNLTPPTKKERKLTFKERKKVDLPKKKERKKERRELTKKKESELTK